MLTRTLLLMAVVVAAGATPIVASERFPSAVEDAYAKYKTELFSKYTDQYGLVVFLKDGKPDGIGDAGWRTGLALICTVIERDNAKSAQLLKALRDKGWRDGRPVRHPDWTDADNKYSRDQFYPQMAGFYYAWRYGNDEVKGLAKDLMGRFVEVLMDNDWKFNTGSAATLPEPGRFVLREVATAMGLGDFWKVDSVQDRIKQKILYDGYRELFIGNITLQAGRVKAGIRTGAPDPDDPMDYYAIHNLFWEILMVYECRHQTSNLTKYTEQLFEACKRHSTAPYYWITRNETEPRQWLASWPPGWNNVDYVWQRNKKQQDNDAASGLGGERYPRLDYMILRRLFDLETER